MKNENICSASGTPKSPYHAQPRCLTDRQTCWTNDLPHLNNILTHVPGAKLIIADALPRRSNHLTKDEQKELVTMLPDKLFARSVTPRLRRRTISSTPRDDSTHPIKKYSKEKGTLPLRTAPSDWTPDDEIILYKGKAYIAPNIRSSPKHYTRISLFANKRTS